MESTTEIKGPIVPMLTPFNENGTIDEETLRKFIDWLVEQRVSAVFPIGGSGERVTLSLEEKKLIMKIVVEQADRRVLVWPGTGGTSLKETIYLSEYAAQIGADAIVVVVPREIEPSEDEIFSYYKELDKNIGLPIYIYEPGGYEPYSITPELFRRLSNLQHIAGIKDSSSNMIKITKMVMNTEGSEVQVIQGNEVLYLTSLPLGIKAVIGGGCNIYPSLFNKLLEEYNNGHTLFARKFQWEIIKRWEILAKSWPLTGKIVLSMRGIPFRPICRVSFKRLNQTDLEDLKALSVYDD
jgi:4-hydroxy-tetrahydrodipicolinate synthase